jgi:hypothetical protein
MASGDGKRRLPVLQPKTPEEEEADLRPAWHWAVIGAVAIVLALVPLLMVSQYFARSSIEALVGPDKQPTPRAWLAVGVLTMTAQIVPLAIASLLGGLFVGRFGGRAGKNEATGAGLAVGLVAALIALPTMYVQGEVGAWLMSAAVFTVLPALLARGGAALGLRRRRGQR